MHELGKDCRRAAAGGFVSRGMSMGRDAKGHSVVIYWRLEQFLVSPSSQQSSPSFVLAFLLHLYSFIDTY